jgi:hypothetical protein
MSPFEGKELRARWCPQCDKQRLLKPLDKEVSYNKEEFETRDGSKVSLFTDICEYCQVRNFRKYFEPTKADAKKVMKALKEATEGDNPQDETSLEEML